MPVHTTPRKFNLRNSQTYFDEIWFCHVRIFWDFLYSVVIVVVVVVVVPAFRDNLSCITSRKSEDLIYTVEEAVMCRCVWSRNLAKEEALAQWVAVATKKKKNARVIVIEDLCLLLVTNSNKM